MSTPFQELPRWRQAGRIVAGLVLVAAAYVLLWHWPQQAAQDLKLTQPPEDFSEELRHQVEVQQLENARRQMGAQLFLALAVLAGVRSILWRIQRLERPGLHQGYRCLDLGDPDPPEGAVEARRLTLDEALGSSRAGTTAQLRRYAKSVVSAAKFSGDESPT